MKFKNKIRNYATSIALIFCVIGSGSVQGDQSTDYTALIGSLTTISVASGNTFGVIGIHGRNSFPILMQSASPFNAVYAAGYYEDDINRARIVVASHTALSAVGAGAVGDLNANALRWAGRKDSPVVGVGYGLGGAPNVGTVALEARGFTVKAISREMDSSSTDLSGVDVFAVHLHQAYTPAAWAKIVVFAQQGGGLIFFGTPWAMSTGQVTPFLEGYHRINQLLVKFGLSYGTGTISQTTYTISPTAPSSYHSALNAVDALIKDYNQEITLSLSDKSLCAGSIEKALGIADIAELNDRVKILNNSYGWINITNTNKLVKANQPIEAMLTRYQSNLLSKMDPEQLPVHPSASDWPGLPGEGDNVTRTVTINGNTPTPSLMAYGGGGVRYSTGLYARPGSAITLTTPADKITAGLRVQVGVHQDENWNLTTWRRHPKVYRMDALKTEVTKTGCAWGGNVFIWVPASQSLGNFDVTISGAIQAPHFKYGVTTEAEWNDSIKNFPGSWGIMESDRITLFVASKYLRNISDPNRAMGHWDTSVATADEYMGYLNRKRGEAALTDRDITVGGGHAGYPFIMAYGDTDRLVNSTVTSGDWGFYHELGHSYQADFGSAYTIASHAEVDVNLVPGLLQMLVHGNTSWDVPTLNFYGANHRLSRRANFFALPEDQQTWAEACNLNSNKHVAYDFYYNLADAYGWQLYKTAHSRLFRFLQNPDNEPEIKALDSADPNYKRNRIFLLYSQAAGKNLAPYFERYGLGKSGAPITQSVKDKVAHLPVWTDNSPVSSLSNPGTLSVPVNTPAETAIYTFSATDPDLATVFKYEIVSGNEGGAFTINKRTGMLRTAAIDTNRSEPYTLTVKVSDNGVPSYSLETTFNVIASPPAITSALSTVTSYGSTFNYAITATNSPSGFTATGLPAGLRFDAATGIISGTLKTAGEFNIAISVSNSAGIRTASLKLVSTIAALVNNAPAINGSLDGSIQVLSNNNVTLNSHAKITGDLLVPGTPNVIINGHPNMAGTVNGEGNTATTGQIVTVNSNVSLRYLVRHTDSVALPSVAAPALPEGVVNVVIDNESQTTIDFSTLRNLTLNSKAGVVAIPAGTYGNFIANGASGFIIGTEGATEPSIYNLQNLTLNSGTKLKIVGPVIFTVGNAVSFNGLIGSQTNPEWLKLRIASGGVNVYGDALLYGDVIAPLGSVIINGTVHGRVIANSLTINGTGSMKERTP